MATYIFNKSNFNLIQLMDEVDAVLGKKLYAKNSGDITDGYCDSSDTKIIFKFYVDLTTEEQVVLSDTVDSHIINSDYIPTSIMANGLFFVSNTGATEGVCWSNKVVFTGPLAFNSDLTPSALTANTNNYNPSGLSTCNFLRLSSDGNYNITGFMAPVLSAGNQSIFVCNVGLKNITLKNNDSNSISENRFLLGGDKNIQSDEGIVIMYDQKSQRWRSQAVNI